LFVKMGKFSEYLAAQTDGKDGAGDAGEEDAEYYDEEGDYDDEA
jgi:hypothetical protein